MRRAAVSPAPDVTAVNPQLGGVGRQPLVTAAANDLHAPIARVVDVFGSLRSLLAGCRGAGEEPVEFVAGLVAPGVRDPLQLEQVTGGHRASGQ